MSGPDPQDRETGKPARNDSAGETGKPARNDSAGETGTRARNRLAGESSAYLQQHAGNPVDWYPWGEEAFERARREDRPVLVSIGYSACHWCHVMERESFEDPEIAALLNEHFVNVKVDREERPDVDQIYMETSLRLNGHGGWPLNAICTPDGRPFFVGTYFPPRRRGQAPGLPEVIEAVSRAWREQRGAVEENADQIAAALRERPEGEAHDEPGLATIRKARALLMRNADLVHGGFGRAPKFPTPTNLEFLTTALDFVDHDEATATARFLTLTAREMARRGLYDQLGGGFHRYCVDASWTIPHFEKMLYDQGQLLSFYAELARRAHDAGDLLWPIRETVDYLRREMRGPEGAFFASQDADSEGHEGRFFVWTPEQIADVLGPEADAFCATYGVRAGGNFEHGTTHLVDEARAPRGDWQDARAKLFAARRRRIAPATDRKYVAAWNGYVISGLARAASVVGEASYLEDAMRAADFLLETMRDADGGLLRVHDAGRAHTTGFLDDHAALLVACLDLHRAGAGARYLASATAIAHAILERFADREHGVLYLTPSDAAPLIHRPRPEHDGATPDAQGLALLGLTRLAALADDHALEAFVERAIQAQAHALEETPHAFPTLLRALALRVRGVAVAVVVGAEDDPATRALAARARRVLRPEDAIVVARPGEGAIPGVASDWLAGREAIGGRATAYLCLGRVCSLPVQDPAALIADLVPSA
ncbi:MAG: thioredoxin domain-containing protein [Myxococcota bacterium]